MKTNKNKTPQDYTSPSYRLASLRQTTASREPLVPTALRHPLRVTDEQDERSFVDDCLFKAMLRISPTDPLTD